MKDAMKIAAVKLGPLVIAKPALMIPIALIGCAVYGVYKLIEAEA